MTYIYQCITCGQDFYCNSKGALITACPACGKENIPLKQCTTNNKTNPNDLVMGTLTKREYFSAMIIQGLLADENITGDMAIPTCVKFADALIKELNK